MYGGSKVAFSKAFMNFCKLAKRIIHELPLVYPRLSKPPHFQYPEAFTTFVEKDIYELDVRESLVTGSSQNSGAQHKNSLHGELVIIHVFYEEIALKIIKEIDFPKGVTFVLTGSNLDILKRIRSKLSDWKCTIYLVANHGRDVYPFLLLCDLPEIKSYSIFWKLHTKRSPHLDYGNLWLDEILSTLKKGRNLIDELFLDQETFPWLLGSKPLKSAHRKYFNFFWMKTLASDAIKSDVFFPGTMFIGNTHALSAIADEKLIKYVPEIERGQLDGTLVHAIERLIGIIIRKRNGRIIDIRGAKR